MLVLYLKFKIEYSFQEITSLHSFDTDKFQVSVLNGRQETYRVHEMQKS